MILIIDNYDSFSYNLVQMIGSILVKESEIKESELKGLVESEAVKTEEVMEKAVIKEEVIKEEVIKEAVIRELVDYNSKIIDIRVIRNDEVTVSQIQELKPSHIIISPGPGKPKDAGICEELIRAISNESCLLGICLGHQAICEALGSKITYAKELNHGKQSLVQINKEEAIFKGLSSEILVGRYHSLAVEEESLSSNLDVIARAKDGEIMAIKHKSNNIYGLQFHPESILTKDGEIILKNFLSL